MTPKHCPSTQATDKFLTVKQVVLVLHRLVRDLDRAGDRILRAELGLSYSRALLLVALDLEGPMSQQELADWLSTSGPAVTGLLRALSADDLVLVSEDQRNRRRNVVQLTADGRRIVRAARRLLDRRFDDLLHTSGVDSGRLLEALGRIEATMASGGS